MAKEKVVLSRDEMKLFARQIGVTIADFEKGWQFHIGKGARAKFVAQPDCPLAVKKAFIFLKIFCNGNRDKDKAILAAKWFTVGSQFEMVQLSKNVAREKESIPAITVACSKCGEYSALTHLANIAGGHQVAFDCGHKNSLTRNTTGRSQVKKYNDLEAAFQAKRIDASNMEIVDNRFIDNRGRKGFTRNYHNLFCKDCAMPLAPIDRGSLLKGSKPSHIRADGIKTPSCPANPELLAKFAFAQTEHKVKILCSPAEFVLKTNKEIIPIQYRACGCISHKVLKESLLKSASVTSNGCPLHSTKNGHSQDAIFRRVLTKIQSGKKLTANEKKWAATTSSVSLMTVKATHPHTGQTELILKLGVATGPSRYKNVEEVLFSVEMPRPYVYFIEQTAFELHTELFGYAIGHQITAFARGKSETAHISNRETLLKTVTKLYNQAKKLELHQLDIPDDTHGYRSRGALLPTVKLAA